MRIDSAVIPTLEDCIAKAELLAPVALQLIDNMRTDGRTTYIGESQRMMGHKHDLAFHFENYLTVTDEGSNDKKHGSCECEERTGNCRISIYNQSTSTTPELFETMVHELTHYTQIGIKRKILDYSVSTPDDIDMTYYTMIAELESFIVSAIACVLQGYDNARALRNINVSNKILSKHPIEFADKLSLLTVANDYLRTNNYE